MWKLGIERVLRSTLVAIAICGLAAGVLARVADRPELAGLIWTIGTAPVAAALALFIVRDLRAGRFGVDAIALLSMTAALALGEPLAGAVVALMYSGGNVLEDVAVLRAEHDLRALVDRAPRLAHRLAGAGIEDVPVGDVAVGDRVLVRAGEIIPVDGVVGSDRAVIDESALTGEPIPVGQAEGRASLQRRVECRRDLRDDRVIGRRRKHLCGYRAAGNGGAGRQGAVRAARRSLCAHVPAVDAGGGRRSRGSSPAIWCAASRCWSRPRPARSFWRHRSPSSPASPARPDAASWSKAAARWRSWRAPIRSCSTRPEP